MYRFGFELEGFYRKDDGNIGLPPTGYPVDGFPGLCEVRSNGAKSLTAAYYEMLQHYMEFPFDATVHEYTFTPAEKRKLRQRPHNKDVLYINNIYGKEPRALGNRTLASLQINVSYEVRAAYTNDKGVLIPAVYGLFDFYPIVRRLDKEFATEIAASKRSPGWYAAKDHARMEYRSLPNSVFGETSVDIKKLLARFERAVEHV